MISDESDNFNPREPRPADAGKPSKNEKRRAARQLATQALYQRHMAGTSLNEIEAQFRVDAVQQFPGRQAHHAQFNRVQLLDGQVQARCQGRIDLGQVRMHTVQDVVEVRQVGVGGLLRQLMQALEIAGHVQRQRRR